MALRESFRLGVDIGRQLWLHRRPFLLDFGPGGWLMTEIKSP